MAGTAQVPSSDSPIVGGGNDAEQGTHGHADATPADIATVVVIGRASEYFDYFVYGIASVIVFPAVFFPEEPRLTGTLYSFLLFALAFVARPFGTAFFMGLQRRYGSGPKMTVALMLLGTATAGIAFIPTYDALGHYAIWLLALFRLLQGVATGGAWDGLPSLLALVAPKGNRGRYAMLGQLGAPLGFLIAAALFAALSYSLSETDFLAWGWRYPFFVAFALNVVALFARLRVVIAPEFEQSFQQRQLAPVATLELIRHQFGNLMLGAFSALASYALFHLVTIFPLSWISLFTKQSVAGFLVVQCVGAVLAIVATVLSGYVADSIGRRQTVAGCAVLIAIFSGFAPTLLDGGEIGQDIFVLLGFTLLGFSYGQAAGVMNDSFEPRFRYTGAALTSDLAWLFGAGFAPVVALGLSANFGLFYTSLYLLSGAVATFAALWLNKRLRAGDAEQDREREALKAARP